MTRLSLRTRATAIALGALLACWVAVPATAKTASSEMLSADLDGAPIKLAEVGRWYCDDFSYPVIHCFSTPEVLESRTSAVLATAAVDFVTVYELGLFAGSFMHMSQDYTALVTIGWNDRISSLKGRNSERSHFYVDWFYGGTSYSVCCNGQLGSLGSFDNTFSSVHRN